MCFRPTKKGKSKVPSRGFYLHDSEDEQRALQLLHMYFSNVISFTPQLRSQIDQIRLAELLYGFTLLLSS